MNQLSMKERDKVIGLLSMGWTQRQIERETGHRRETVARIGREAGPLPPKCTGSGEVPADSKAAKVATNSRRSRSSCEPFRSVIEVELARAAIRYRFSSISSTITATRAPTTPSNASSASAWRKRAPSERAQADAAIGDAIEVHFERSRCTYGRPRIQCDLREVGMRVSDKRIARLMRERKIQGASRRKA